MKIKVQCLGTLAMNNTAYFESSYFKTGKEQCSYLIYRELVLKKDIQSVILVAINVAVLFTEMRKKILELNRY